MLITAIAPAVPVAEVLAASQDPEMGVMEKASELEQPGNELSALTFSLDEAGEQPIELKPEFSPEITEYQIFVEESNLPTSDSFLYLTGVFPEQASAKFHFMLYSNATIIPGGKVILVSGVPSGNKKKSLFVSGNSMENYVEVTPDAATGLSSKKYFITMTMIPNLKSLAVSDEKSGAELPVSFDPLTKEYSLYVNKDVTSIVIAAAAVNKKNTVSINGNTVGKDAQAALAEGRNQFEIQVTDSYGAADTYTLYVEQACPTTLRVAPMSCSLKVYDSENQEMNLGEAASADSYKMYTPLLPSGTYRYEGVDADGNSIGGAEFEVKDSSENQEFDFRQVNFKADNSGFTAGSDYTVQVSTDSQDELLKVGAITADGQYPVLALCGTAYNYELQPGEEKAALGYHAYAESVTIAMAAAAQSISHEMLIKCEQNFIIPAEANLLVETKSAPYTVFETITPISDGVDNEDGTITYRYDLRNEQVYNYRVREAGKVTLANKFTALYNAADIVVTAAELAGDPRQIDRNLNSNNNNNVGDIYLGINEQNYLTLNPGETFPIVSLRNRTAVDSTTNSDSIEPDYHFTVINENGQADNSVVEVDQKGMLTAVAEGTAIVMVSYDAAKVYGDLYGAIWPENTGVFVVSVGSDAADVKLGMTLHQGENSSDDKCSGDAVDAEHDVFYYLDSEAGAYYSFAKTAGSTVSILRPVLSATEMNYSGGYSETGITEQDGNVTVLLTAGRNIIKVTKDGKSNYQVLTAKKAAVTITNASEGKAPEQRILPGDKVKVKFSTVFHPANKLTDVYNMSAQIRYGDSYTGVCASGDEFAADEAAQTIELTIPEDYEAAAFVLENGYIQVSGDGEPYGGHRGIGNNQVKNPNFMPQNRSAKLSVLPDLEIPVFTPQQQADEVEAMPIAESIKLLPEVSEVTLADKQQIEAAWQLYQELTPQQQEFVTNIDKLTELLQQIEKLERDAQINIFESGMPVVKTKASAYNTVIVSWNEYADAESYIVYRKTAGGSFKELKTVKELSYTDKTAVPKVVYYYTVVAASTKWDTEIYSQSHAKGIKAVTALTAVKWSSVKSAGYKSVKLAWKKVDGASGYRIYRVTSKNGTYQHLAEIKKGKTTAYTDSKKLIAGKTYYYEIRAYRTVNGNKIYGDYSTIKATKVVPATVKITKVKGSAKAIKVSWSKAGGASGYQIYRAASKNGNYQLLKQVDNKTTAYKNSNLKTGKSYYYKVRAYRTVDGKKVYGAFSEIKTGKAK